MPHRPTVVFLVGKPLARSPVLPDVAALLTGDGVAVVAHVPRPDDDLIALEGVPDADVVVLRGLGARLLRRATAIEDAGVRCCNPPRAALGILDRAATATVLTTAGVPVPAGLVVAGWHDARAHAADRPVVVKAVDGTAGRGAGVHARTSGTLPPEAPFDGPYIVQEHIDGDGVDRKLYVLGDHVAGLLKRWPRDPAEPRGRVFVPDAELVAIARRTAQATRLEVCGVDVIIGGDGPMVVDVNAFPSAAGVPRAAEAVAEHLLRLARPEG